MASIRYVGDGARDEASLPRLVAKLLGRAGDATSFVAWKDTRLRGKGYEKKLLFAIRAAADDCCDAVVAAVDRDLADKRDRLRELHRGRDAAGNALPTALGEADPHAEAWLLDDEQAVCEALQRDREGSSFWNGKDPKGTLDALIAKSPRAHEARREILADVAAALLLQRCAHAKDTGLQDFADDLKARLGRLPQA